LGNKNISMRRWQQDLALATEASDFNGAEADTVPEVQEPKKETVTDYHIAAAVFVCTFILLLTFKPVLILHRSKDRAEEAPSISVLAVIVLCTLSSALYLALVFQVFDFSGK
jgi:hypothetical protein